MPITPDNIQAAAVADDQAIAAQEIVDGIAAIQAILDTDSEVYLTISARTPSTGAAANLGAGNSLTVTGAQLNGLMTALTASANARKSAADAAYQAAVDTINA